MQKLRSGADKFFSLSGAGVFVALVVFIILVSLIAPQLTGGQFLTGANFMNIIRQQSYVGIMACGMTFVILTANIDLSVGSQLTLLAVICAMLTKSIGDLAIPATIVFGILCGLVNGVLVGGLRMNSFIVTLGTGSMFGGIVLVIVSATTARGESALFDAIGSGVVLGFLPIPTLITIIVILIFAFVLSRTVFGRHLYAIGANPRASRYSGVHNRRDVGIAFTLNGICCSIAAIVLVARTIGVAPQAGAGKEMDVVLAVVLGGTSVLGGKGSIWGTVIGFLFIGFMSSGFTFLGLSQYIQWMVTGAILLTALAMDVASGKGGGLWKKKRA